MIVCVDFDGTVVYKDRETPELLPGAREGLESLKRAGHVLILQSARASAAERLDPMLHPLTRAREQAGEAFDLDYWREHVQPEAEALYQEMLAFVEKRLPGVFDAIDDGVAGKLYADLYLDDRSRRLGPVPATGVVDWRYIARRYGEPADTEESRA